MLTSDRSPKGIRAAIRSGDGNYWADCWLRNYTNDRGTVATYRDASEDAGTEIIADMETEGHWVTYLDRFPDEVARVELDFACGGPTLSAEAVDGFVALEAERRDIPDNATCDADVTMYDADGDPLVSTKDGEGIGTRYDSVMPDRPLSRVGNPDPH